MLPYSDGSKIPDSDKWPKNVAYTILDGAVKVILDQVALANCCHFCICDVIVLQLKTPSQTGLNFCRMKLSQMAAVPWKL